MGLKNGHRLHVRRAHGHEAALRCNSPRQHLHMLSAQLKTDNDAHTYTKTVVSYDNNNTGRMCNHTSCANHRRGQHERGSLLGSQHESSPGRGGEGCGASARGTMMRGELAMHCREHLAGRQRQHQRFACSGLHPACRAPAEQQARSPSFGSTAMRPSHGRWSR